VSRQTALLLDYLEKTDLIRVLIKHAQEETVKPPAGSFQLWLQRIGEAGHFK